MTDLTDFKCHRHALRTSAPGLDPKNSRRLHPELATIDRYVALIGYESLAQELDEIQDLRAIFVATSSGTTAQAWLIIF